MKRNNVYKRKVQYYQAKILQKKKIIDDKLTYINEISKKYLIDSSLLYGILLIEKLNRGSWIIRVSEVLFIKALYRVVPKDISVGIAQIKISTAKLYMPNLNSQEIANILLDEKCNIQIAAMIISKYYDNHSPNSSYELIDLIKYYTTGSVDTLENNSITIYYILLKWIIDCDLIRK